MATGSVSFKELSDITECPICTEVYTDPRVGYCRVSIHSVSGVLKAGAKTSNQETKWLARCAGKNLKFQMEN
jgi:hypothetical protein